MMPSTPEPTARPFQLKHSDQSSSPLTPLPDTGDLAAGEDAAARPPTAAAERIRQALRCKLRGRPLLGIARDGLQAGTQKKQGATGITTVAPYVAGQWGRGNNRLPG
jgi:hypothetical protein